MQQGPIESFIPVMLFAIVFGLSMDYEVFLVSRIHERWTHTRDNSRAVAEGLALTGRVVTAAAAIMVCVFLSFMLGEDRVIKEFGLSLASAVFLDALVVRCLLLPADAAPVGAGTWRSAGVARPGAAAREHRGHDAARRSGRGATTAPAAAPAAPGAAAGVATEGSGGLSPARRRRAALAPACCARSARSARCARRRRPPRLARAAAARRAARVRRPRASGELAARPGLSVGIMSATQGRYTTGAAAARHHPGRAGRLLGLRPRAPAGAVARDRAAPAAVVAGWQAARRRAERRAAAAAPGPAGRRRSPAARGYAGIARDRGPRRRSVAADRGGRVAAVSLGAAPARCSRGSPRCARSTRWSSPTCPAARGLARPARRSSARRGARASC